MRLVVERDSMSVSMVIVDVKSAERRVYTSIIVTMSIVHIVILNTP